MARGPVFIVGSPRSGTSMLVDVLYAFGYDGFREGNYFSLIHALEQAVDRHFATFAPPDNLKVLASNVDKGDLVGQLARVVADAAVQRMPAPLWFDKTGNPAMILTIPRLRSIWPGCVFIFAKRRGIENVNSRLKKFPSHTFEYQCSDWAKNMEAWRHVRDALDSADYLEVDQQDMLSDPRAVASALVSLLGVDTSKVEAAVDRFSHTRPQQTTVGSAEQVFSLSTIAWSDAQKTVFLDRCADEMSRYGYSLDERYRIGTGS